ncbi:hypothetical protein [Endozoicomonas acroporae]|uniref:hypothetical protein n=1 Tax=Endozoicomonas acroporae TaxID=1701104 RepID=UPI0013D7028B|nr:hypothetical protein [Endozoicomonas acroporae]
MEQLTQKQKDNRAYYAKHAEKIKAKKRAEYTPKAKSPKPPKVKSLKPEKQKYRGEAITIKSAKPAQKRAGPTAEEIARVQARRRIEDLMLARELGIDGF